MTEEYRNWSAPLSPPAPLSPGRFLQLHRLTPVPQVRSFKLDEFWKQILKAWADYPSDVLDKIFDTKRAVVKCIIDAKGENTYKLPHTKKRKGAPRVSNLPNIVTNFRYEVRCTVKRRGL